MIWLYAFGAGLFLGCSIGIFIMCLLQMARERASVREANGSSVTPPRVVKR